MSYRIPLTALALSLLGCTGTIDGGPPGSYSAPALQNPSAMLVLRRLTQYEYARAVDDLIGEAHPETITLYPRDTRTPFDNDASDQTASEGLITGTELMATESTATLMADVPRRDRLVGCTPTGPSDGACMRTFIVGFGRMAIRRPVDAEDVERYATSALAVAAEQGDFYAGASIVVRAFLQHPRFLYRVEIGTPVEGEPGVVRLDGYEVASRLSFLIWGTPPDAALLDAAQRGELNDAAMIAARADMMLNAPRAREQASRLHAMWLNYEILPHPQPLSQAMRDETSALIEHVLFEDERPWHDLFRANGTYIGDTLATHYGLPPPGSTTPTFVPYGSSGRAGILSHGAFLSNGSETGEKIPIYRGLAVRRRLLCTHIELPAGFMPPPLMTPTAGQCRPDVLMSHRTGGCAGCHSQMDPIGFGLEQFDGQGRFQSAEPGRPECTVNGQGDLDGVAFVGPSGLSNALIESGDMAGCFESELYRYAIGRSQLDMSDQRILAVMEHLLDGSEFTYRDLVHAIVSSRFFTHRRLPE